MPRLLPALLAALLALGACNGNDQAQEDPKAALVTALENMADDDALSVTLSLESTVESMQALDESGGLSREVAEKILGSSLTIAGRQAENVSESNFQLTANIAGQDDLELRVVNENLYVRADVQGLAETFGAPPGALDQLSQQAALGGLEFVQPALEGRWLSLPGATDLLGQAAQQPDAQQQKAAEELVAAVKENASVTWVGEEDAGAHVAASVPLRETYQRLIKNQQLLGAPLPPGTLPPPGEVPNEDVNVDFWLDGDRVTQAELDLIQVARIAGEEVPEGADRLAFRIVFDEFEGEVEAPDDAVVVNPQEVFGAFFGGLQGSSVQQSRKVRVEGAGDAAFPCELLEGEPRSVKLQFKEECPQLLND